MVARRDTGHRGQGDVRHEGQWLQAFFGLPKPLHLRTPRVHALALPCQPNAVALPATPPSMPSRKQPVAQEPCRSVHLELTDPEGASDSHS